jgi:hypothetical protein
VSANGFISYHCEKKQQQTKTKYHPFNNIMTHTVLLPVVGDRVGAGVGNGVAKNDGGKIDGGKIEGGKPGGMTVPVKNCVVLFVVT